MANLVEVDQWDAGIYQFETSDPVEGGADGIDNVQAKALANRTLYLKNLVTALTNGKQPLDATLTALAALVTSQDKLIYATGADTFAQTTLTAFMRTLLDDADAAAARTTLGLGSASTLIASTDGTLAGNSDAEIPTEKAVKTYVDGLIAANDAMVFKGVIDCSTNPNYPAADQGHTYRVSVAGKIGGAAGINVEAGDILLCQTNGTVAGTHAAAGENWAVIQANLDGALLATAIGVTVQAYDATLAALAALVTSADKLIYATGANTFATTTLSAFIRTLLDDADAAAARTTLGAAGLATAQTYTAAQRGAVGALAGNSTPITPDFSLGNNFEVTLSVSATLANPTNRVAGQSGVIKIIQDGAGSKTLAYGGYWKFAGGSAPTLTTTANAVDVLAYYVESATRITAKLTKDVK